MCPDSHGSKLIQLTNLFKLLAQSFYDLRVLRVLFCNCVKSLRCRSIVFSTICTEGQCSTYRLKLLSTQQQSPLCLAAHRSNCSVSQSGLLEMEGPVSIQCPPAMRCRPLHCSNSLISHKSENKRGRIVSLHSRGVSVQ